MSFHKINKYIFTLQRCSLSKYKCLVIIWFNGRLKKGLFIYFFLSHNYPSRLFQCELSSLGDISCINSCFSSLI